MPDHELDRIDPVPVTAALRSGFVVQIVRMRTRQFFRLLRVLTSGAGPEVLATLNFQDPDFGTKLLAALLLAIPEAEEQAVTFIQSMVRPAGMHEKENRKSPELSKDQLEENKEKWAQLSDEFFNPDLEDLITVLEEVIKQEAPEIQALGKRLSALGGVVTRALPTTETTTETGTSSDGPEKTGT